MLGLETQWKTRAVMIRKYRSSMNMTNERPRYGYNMEVMT